MNTARLFAPNIGAGIYMTLNRLLIPFGLHHVLSSTDRFTEAGDTWGDVVFADARYDAKCFSGSLAGI